MDQCRTVKIKHYCGKDLHENVVQWCGRAYGMKLTEIKEEKKRNFQ